MIVSLALHDEGCGLTARPLMLGATDLVLLNLSGCRNLPDVMRTIAHTYNILHGGSYNRVEVRSDRLTYVIDDTCFSRAFKRWTGSTPAAFARQRINRV